MAIAVEAARPEAPFERCQSEGSESISKLGLTSSGHRRRVPSDVNLADLLKRENSSTKLEPNGQPFSGSQRSSSNTDLCNASAPAMPDFETSYHNSTTSIGAMSFASASTGISSEDEFDMAPREHGGRSIRLSIFCRDTSNPNLTTFEDLASSAAQLTKDDTAFEMEIYPGHYVPFQNANSIWKAVARGHGHTMEYTCLDCQIELVSVIDCEHIVCPECQMVNPIFEWPAGVTPVGAGMGLKKSWVVQKSSFGPTGYAADPTAAA